MNLRDSEIGNLQPSIGSNQNILRLQITMNHMPHMQILQSDQNIAEIPHNCVDIEVCAASRLYRALTNDQRLKTASGRVFHHNVHKTGYLKVVFAAHDSRMLQIAEQIDFTRHHVPMLQGSAILLRTLSRILAAGPTAVAGMQFDALYAAKLTMRITAEINGTETNKDNARLKNKTKETKYPTYPYEPHPSGWMGLYPPNRS